MIVPVPGFEFQRTREGGAILGPLQIVTYSAAAVIPVSTHGGVDVNPTLASLSLDQAYVIRSASGYFTLTSATNAAAQLSAIDVHVSDASGLFFLPLVLIPQVTVGVTLFTVDLYNIYGTAPVPLFGGLLNSPTYRQPYNIVFKVTIFANATSPVTIEVVLCLQYHVVEGLEFPA